VPGIRTVMCYYNVTTRLIDYVIYVTKHGHLVQKSGATIGPACVESYESGHDKYDI
jgi:hypothetical protein